MMERFADINAQQLGKVVVLFFNYTTGYI